MSVVGNPIPYKNSWFFCHIPVLGIIPSIDRETAILNAIINAHMVNNPDYKKTHKPEMTKRLVELFELKAQHITDSGIRNALTSVPLIICYIALRTLALSPLLIPLSIFFVGKSLCNVYEAHLIRERIINDLHAGKPLPFKRL
jgi:hypothetical protein